jgi:hypothetical protein
MKYFGNESNIILGAELSATNVEPSDAVYRAAIERTGGGLVQMSGPYEGQEDTVIEVEILNDTITGDPQFSAPTFDGVGNGTLTDLEIDTGVDAQRFDVTLIDVGTETRRAYVPFQGIELRARLAGAVGNGLRIAVDSSGLAKTATNFSLLNDLQASTNDYVGIEWDFDAAVLEPEGTIPFDAPRIVFGDDPQVYRAYKQYIDGRYVHSFSPPPVRTVQKGAKVKAVTGSHNVTVTQGLAADADVFQTAHPYAGGEYVTPITPNGHWYLCTAAGTSAGSSPTWPTNGGSVTSNTATFLDLGVIVSTYGTTDEVTYPIFDNAQRPSAYTLLSDFTIVDNITAAWDHQKLTEPKTSGKWSLQFEALSTGTIMYGIINSDAALGNYAGHSSNAGISRADNVLFYGGSSHSFPGDNNMGNWSGTSIDGLLVDITAGKIWFFDSSASGNQRYGGIPESDVLAGNNPAATFTPGLSIVGAVSLNGLSTAIRVVRPGDVGYVDPLTGFPAWSETGEVVGDGITTLYSLLNAIQSDAQALVTVVQPVVNDASPNGMGVNELSVITRSFVASLDREGTQYAKDADIGLGVGTTSPTQELTIRCKTADSAGDETWAVVGTVSGTLSDATTAVAYSNSGITFTVPEALPPAVAPSGERRAYLDLLDRSADETEIPSLCYENLIAGSEARSRVYEFIWKHRPAEACECDTSSIVGGPNDDFLGIESGVVDMATIPTELQSRTEDLTELVAGLADTSVTVTVDGVSFPNTRYIQANSDDIAALKRVVSLFYATMRAVFDATEDFTGAPATEYDAIFTDLQTDLAAVDVEAATADNRWAVEAEGMPAVDTFFDKYTLRLRHVYTLAGIEPNFEDAGHDGNDVWQDHGADYWFVDREGRLLPIQPGFYYHAAVLATDEITGDDEPVATHEFGIGVQIGCVNKMLEGDRLFIELDVAGNVRTTYQVGDTFTAKIIAASPIPLGGGQTGNDQLTFRVIGSVDGALDNYIVDTTDPDPFDDGGVSFLITPGGIRFALGDSFSFYVEGGEFRWRQDGGSWSANVAIAPEVSLVDGLSLTFEPGAAPSFVDGDLYTFTAEAINGPEQARTPRDGALRMSGPGDSDPDDPNSNNFVADCGSAKTATCLFIAEHSMSAGDELILEASTVSDFASLVNTETIVVATDRYIYAEFDSTTARYWRIRPEGPADFGWIYLGIGLEMALRTGLREAGSVVRRLVLPTATRHKAFAATVEHEGVTQDSVEAMEDLLAYASENDEGRIGVVANGVTEPRAMGLVMYVNDTLESTDQLRYMALDTDNRLVSVTVELQAVA